MMIKELNIKLELPGGLSLVRTTCFPEVTPNELYNIKLVVADDGDTIYDSARG